MSAPLQIHWDKNSLAGISVGPVKFDKTNPHAIFADVPDGILRNLLADTLSHYDFRELNLAGFVPEPFVDCEHYVPITDINDVLSSISLRYQCMQECGVETYEDHCDWAVATNQPLECYPRVLVFLHALPTAWTAQETEEFLSLAAQVGIHCVFVVSAVIPTLVMSSISTRVLRHGSNAVRIACGNKPLTTHIIPSLSVLDAMYLARNINNSVEEDVDDVC